MATTTGYAKRPYLISKHELCIILAFWMEESPLVNVEEITYYNPKTDKTKVLNGVGAVLLLPNDRIFAIDCSRDGVHGVVNLLTKFPHDVQGGTIFASRKPCSLCTKLLVQCRVSRVFYLPIKPENTDEDDIKRVDHLFKVSQVGTSVFVPRIDHLVIEEGESKKPNYSPTSQANEDARVEYIKDRMRKYWGDKWIKKLKVKLPWLAFDEAMEAQVGGDMKRMVEWISKMAILDPCDFVLFQEYRKQRPKINRAITAMVKSGPDVENLKWQELALHLSRMAKIIAHKTDDPKTGVGAVILMENKEIVAVGWNGFPSKALYGEFPRASDTDEDVTEKKYAYVIHAEQNALFTRNKGNIASDSTTLFVTKTPCDECVPLLIQAGVKNVVLPSGQVPKPEEDVGSGFSATTSEEKQHPSPTSSSDGKSKSNKQLGYAVFCNKLIPGQEKFKCFVSYDQRDKVPDALKKQKISP